MNSNKHIKALICIIILIFFAILITNKIYPSNNFISGGNGTHWKHLEGTIKKIDLQNKSLVVISQNEEFMLDCSNDFISLDMLNVGDTIIYYFFPNTASKNNGYTIKVSEIKKIEK